MDKYLNKQNTEGNTLLHITVEFNNKKVVEQLLNNKVNVNVQNHKGETPLHLATGLRRPEIIQLLLDHLNAKDIDVNKKDNNQKTPLVLILDQPIPPLYGPGSFELHMLRDFFDVNACRSLLQKDNTSINEALYIAVKNMLLVSQGNSEHERKGIVENSLSEIINLLMEHKPSINWEDDEGNNLLHLFARSDYNTKSCRFESLNSIISLLLKDKHIINKANKKKQTPLDIVKHNTQMQDLLRYHGGKTFVQTQVVEFELD